jgi:starvation-inducible DNA-binding protein
METATIMHKTRIDISSETRQRMIQLLNQQLADIFDLYSQAKQAHWNVKGSDFFQLHELFDELADELRGYSDMIAERATALGGNAMGTVRMAAANSRLEEYDLGIHASMETVSLLADRYASLAETTREAIDTAENLGDMSTSDLFIEISRGLDQRLWFLEAHLQ